MIRKITAALLAIALVPALAIAQPNKKDYDTCAGDDDDKAIPACTRLVNAGRLNQKQKREVHYNRALSYANKRRYDEAIADYTTAINADPSHPHAYNNRGILFYERKNDLNRAKADYDKAIELDPAYAFAYNNRGNIFNDLKNPAAIEVFTKIIRQQPTNGEHQRSLGRAYWFAGDLEKAEMRFNLAVKLKPDYVDAWLDLISLSAAP